MNPIASPFISAKKNCLIVSGGFSVVSNLSSFGRSIHSGNEHFAGLIEYTITECGQLSLLASDWLKMVTSMLSEIEQINKMEVRKNNVNVPFQSFTCVGIQSKAPLNRIVDWKCKQFSLYLHQCIGDAIKTESQLHEKGRKKCF